MTLPSCKGWCDRYGGIRSLKSIRSTEGRISCKYTGGVRYCPRCEKFFLKEIAEQFDRGVYCPCCRTKTRGRASNARAEVFELVSY